jgi:hypothetical protein
VFIYLFVWVCECDQLLTGLICGYHIVLLFPSKEVGIGVDGGGGGRVGVSFNFLFLE